MSKQEASGTFSSPFWQRQQNLEAKVPISPDLQHTHTSNHLWSFMKRSNTSQALKICLKLETMIQSCPYSAVSDCDHHWPDFDSGAPPGSQCCSSVAPELSATGVAVEAAVQ